MRILYQYRHSGGGGGGSNKRCVTTSPAKSVGRAIVGIATVTLTVAGIMAELMVEAAITFLLVTIIFSVIAKLNRK